MRCQHLVTPSEMWGGIAGEWLQQLLEPTQTYGAVGGGDVDVVALLAKVPLTNVSRTPCTLKPVYQG